MNQNIYINEIPSAEVTIYDNGTPVTVVIANGAVSQNKVPYTGATQNVDLGEYGISAGFVQLDTTPTAYTPAVGNIGWNDTVGTLETTLKGGNVSLKIGRDMFERVVNKTGVQLTKAAYQAVRVSTAQGQRLGVALAQANNDNNSADTIGVAVETIDINQEGMVFTVGEIGGINTTGSLQGESWADGDVLYLSPTIAGRVTNIKPVAPQHLVVMGYVVYAHANQGKIYVKIMNGWELGELHDVDTTGATNGQVLTYNGSIWIPSTNGSGTVTSITASSPLTGGTITTSGTIGIPQATSSADGYLSSSDWSTFNSKQNALTNPVTGTGASGQVSYWTGTTSQSGSNNLFWDNANGRLGIGTNTPSYALDIKGATPTINLSIANADQFLILQGAGGTEQIINAKFNLNLQSNGTTGIFLARNTRNVIIQNGGTFTDSGQRLQVTGDTLLKGSGNTSGTTALTVQNSSSANALTIKNNRTTNLTSDAGQIILSSSADAANGVIEFDINSSATQTVFATLTRGSVGTATTAINQTAVRINGGFTPTSGTATWNSLHINGTINQTGGANGITRGIFIQPVLTSASDWRSIQWENSTGWGLYGAGTANNYLGGNLGIGSTTTGSIGNLVVARNITGGTVASGIRNSGTVQSDVTSAIRYFTTEANTVAGTFNNLIHYNTLQTGIGTVSSQYGFLAASSLTGATNNYGFYGDIASGAGRWNLYMNGTALNYLNGNLLLGTTTDAGFKLDVNGTARVTPPANSVGLTLSGYSLTGSNAQSAVDISGTWNTTGTPSAILVNITDTASNGNSNFINFQIAGSTRIRIGKDGRIAFPLASIRESSGILDLRSGLNAAGDEFLFANGQVSSRTYTSGTGNILRTGLSFEPTSGTGVYNVFQYNGTINQTGGANGITRGLFVNPTLTAAADWRAIEAVSASNANHTLMKLRNATVDVLTVKADSKIGFFNATPVAQPTTGIAEATFVENSGGTAVNVDSTFAGYTIQQIAQALKDLGILA